MFVLKRILGSRGCAWQQHQHGWRAENVTVRWSGLSCVDCCSLCCYCDGWWLFVCFVSILALVWPLVASDSQPQRSQPAENQPEQTNRGRTATQTQGSIQTRRAFKTEQEDSSHFQTTIHSPPRPTAASHTDKRHPTAAPREKQGASRSQPQPHRSPQ